MSTESAMTLAPNGAALLVALLSGLLLRAFSPTGRGNRCRRFQLASGELEAVLRAYEQSISLDTAA